MSVPTPAGPQPPYYAPPVPRPPRKKWPWVVGALVALPVLVVGIVVVIAVGKIASGPCLDKSQQAPCAGPGGTWVSADGQVRPRGATGTATTSPSVPAYVAPATSEPVLPEPTAKDYSVALTIVSKQCFGSAGCNVVVEPKLSMLGASALLWDCDITYSISGDDSGEVIETAYSQGGSSYRVDRTVMSTKSGKVAPKATVTSVSCRKS